LDLIHLPSIRVDKKFETKADKKKEENKLKQTYHKKPQTIFLKESQNLIIF